jgi:hypothetical protein
MNQATVDGRLILQQRHNRSMRSKMPGANVRRHLFEALALAAYGWMQKQAAENNRTRELEQMIGELRGELRVVRSMIDDARSNNVIDVPRSCWRHDAA